MKRKHSILLAAAVLSCVGGGRVLANRMQEQKQENIVKSIFEDHSVVIADSVDVTDSFLCQHLSEYEQKQYASIYKDIDANDYEISSFYTNDNTPLFTKHVQDSSCMYDADGTLINAMQ